MFSEKWDYRFMALASHIGEWSKERGRRFGAVIVGPDREVRSMGYNGIPRGVEDDDESRHTRDDGMKYYWSAHAEVNAIFNAARVGIPVKGCTIYVPLFPCSDCAKAIIQSGIACVVTHRPGAIEPVWETHFKVSSKMMEEAGIQIRYLEQKTEIPVGECLCKQG